MKTAVFYAPGDVKKSAELLSALFSQARKA